MKHDDAIFDFQMNYNKIHRSLQGSVFRQVKCSLLVLANVPACYNVL